MRELVHSQVTGTAMAMTPGNATKARSAWANMWFINIYDIDVLKKPNLSYIPRKFIV